MLTASKNNLFENVNWSLFPTIITRPFTYLWIMKYLFKDQRSLTRKMLLYIFPLIIISGCTGGERFIDFNTTELVRLLSGDSVKHWVRTRYSVDGEVQSLSECELSQITTFVFYKNTPASLEYMIETDSVLCNHPASVIETGDCLISDYINSKVSLDSLSFISGGDTATFGINSITSKFFKISGYKNNNRIESDFEWKGLW